MKIQSTHNKQQLRKAQKKQTASTSFADMLNASSIEQTPTDIEQSIQSNTDTPTQDSNPQQTLEKHIKTLEDAILTLEKEPQNSKHVQQTIVDLRQALQQSQLTPQALEDADTLLAVEAKRLASLNSKTP
jgi:uncharacterized coiled-coil DUF342 family protein